MRRRKPLLSDWEKQQEELKLSSFGSPLNTAECQKRSEVVVARGRLWFEYRRRDWAPLLRRVAADAYSCIMVQVR